MESNVLKIGHILFKQRLIQSILGFQRCLCGRCDGFLTHERTAGYRTHYEKRKGDNDPDSQYGQNDSLQDIRKILFAHLHFTFFNGSCHAIQKQGNDYTPLLIIL